MDLTDKGQETDNLEQKIDEMVYELYGIDTEGKNLIEQDLSSYKKLRAHFDTCIFNAMYRASCGAVSRLKIHTIREICEIKISDKGSPCGTSTYQGKHKGQVQ